LRVVYPIMVYMFGEIWSYAGGLNMLPNEPLDPLLESGTARRPSVG
jgi:hypothetical protein